MVFINKNATIFNTNIKPIENITDMCIAAHQDDIEIMAYGPIAQCYDSPYKAFCGVVVTDGAGSPRTGEFANYTNEQMVEVRRIEQQKAAEIGKYACAVQLSYSSADVKANKCSNVVEDIYKCIVQFKPKNIYTHNIADKHPTHVATALRTIEAVRRLPEELKPEKFISLEVWRSLDWLPDKDKICLDTSAHGDVAAELLTVHKSQVAGGKRYDTAAIGRRYANATFFESHGVDISNSINFGLDLMPLIKSDISPADYIDSYIQKFRLEVMENINKMAK